MAPIDWCRLEAAWRGSGARAWWCCITFWRWPASTSLSTTWPPTRSAGPRFFRLWPEPSSDDSHAPKISIRVLSDKCIVFFRSHCIDVSFFLGRGYLFITGSGTFSLISDLSVVKVVIAHILFIWQNNVLCKRNMYNYSVLHCTLYSVRTRILPYTCIRLYQVCTLRIHSRCTVYGDPTVRNCSLKSDFHIVNCLHGKCTLYEYLNIEWKNFF